MRPLIRAFTIFLLCGSLSAALAREAPERAWKQVHPYYRDAYVLSFRSPDLLSNEADERWGAEDGRLVSGAMLTDFPAWLQEQKPSLDAARGQGRRILLSLHVHSGYGSGLVTYAPDLRTAEAGNYPWLVRTLTKLDLGTDDVTVAIDTCNAQATAAYQLRPDLYKAGVAAWPDFNRWRKASPARLKLATNEAFRVFIQDHVRLHLSGSARRSRNNVRAEKYAPLTQAERMAFRAKLYGPRGVILATPTLFNLLRLGPNPQNTMTANLLTARLDGRVVDGYMGRNKAEFRKFKEFGFLAAAGAREDAGTDAIADERGSALRPRRAEPGGQ
jgi:hypothetical protein